MRQSAAHSRHQLLPVPGACAACKWCIAASRWCSDVNVSNGAYGPRSPTQTRPFSSVSALVAAAFGPAVGSAACRVRSGDTRAACIRTRAAAMPLRLRHLLEISCHRHRTWQVQHRMACATKAVSSRECGNQKPMHVTSSSLHVGARSRCAQLVHTSRRRPLVRACSGGRRSCRWLSRTSSRPWP